MSVGRSMASYTLAHAICEGYIDDINITLDDWSVLDGTLYKGQKLIDLIRLSKAPIKFNCKKGTCGSCLSIVNGKKMRVCQMVVNKPIKIKPR